MNDIALILLKPDCFTRNLRGAIFKTINNCELKIIYRKFIQLNETMIRDYQPVLNMPSEFGEEWKKEAIIALACHPVEVLLVEGKEALTKSIQIKRSMRSKYCPGNDYKSRIIFNLIHTADNILELKNNVKVLIPEAEYLL